MLLLPPQAGERSEMGKIAMVEVYIEKIHPTAMLLPAEWEVTKTPAKEK